MRLRLRSAPAILWYLVHYRSTYVGRGLPMVVDSELIALATTRAASEQKPAVRALRARRVAPAHYMCLLALLSWYMTISKEIRDAVRAHFALASVPAGHPTKIVPSALLAAMATGTESCRQRSIAGAAATS